MKYILILLFLFSTQGFANDGEVKELGFLGHLVIWAIGIFLLIVLTEYFEDFFPNREGIIVIIGIVMGIVWTFSIIFSYSDFFTVFALHIIDFFFIIPAIYYFLSAIIVLLVMIFIRLNANKKRED
jgi:hypothetical protein